MEYQFKAESRDPKVLEHQIIYLWSPILSDRVTHPLCPWLGSCSFKFFNCLPFWERELKVLWATASLDPTKQMSKILKAGKMQQKHDKAFRCAWNTVECWNSSKRPSWIWGRRAIIGVARNKTCGNSDCKFCWRVKVLSNQKISLFVQHEVMGRGMQKFIQNTTLFLGLEMAHYWVAF